MPPRTTIQDTKIGLSATGKIVQPAVEYFLQENPKLYYPKTLVFNSGGRELIIISFVLLVSGLILLKLK